MNSDTVAVGDMTRGPSVNLFGTCTIQYAAHGMDRSYHFSEVGGTPHQIVHVAFISPYHCHAPCFAIIYTESRAHSVVEYKQAEEIGSLPSTRWSTNVIAHRRQGKQNKQNK